MQIGKVDLERGRVHGDEHIDLIARGLDDPGAEVDLIGRDPEGGARRGADLGGEVRKSREIVAGQRRGHSEPVAGQLHAVAGIAGKSDDRRFKFPATLTGMIERRGTFHHLTTSVGHRPAPRTRNWSKKNDGNIEPLGDALASQPYPSSQSLLTLRYMSSCTKQVNDSFPEHTHSGCIFTGCSEFEVFQVIRAGDVTSGHDSVTAWPEPTPRPRARPRFGPACAAARRSERTRPRPRRCAASRRSSPSARRRAGPPGRTGRVCPRG